MTATLTIPPVPTDHVLAHQPLVDSVTWQRLVNRIIKENLDGDEAARGLAERIMDQAAGFLALCALEPEGHYGPSPIVDIGWHVFILYTQEYAEFCQRVAGRFLHHSPADLPGVVYPRGGISHTVEAMHRHGLRVDEPLWTGKLECGLGGENLSIGPSDCRTVCGDGDTINCSEREPA